MFIRQKNLTNPEYWQKNRFMRDRETWIFLWPIRLMLNFLTQFT